MNNAQTSPAHTNGKDSGNMHIIDKVRAFITDYTALPGEHYADILALYVLHTHAFGAARTTPYIYITSQGPGSGKTRLMEVMHEISNRSELISGVTGPTLFTLIENVKPTLFIDEVDTIYSGSKNEELRGVLNGGYKHNGRIPRIDKSSEIGVTYFSTFCPKVLAGIDNGQVPNTVLDRAISIVLEKANPGQVQPFYAEDVEDIAADIIDEIGAWVAANSDALRNRDNRPAPIDELNDRQNDIARPLLMIADRIPGWHKRARRAFIRALGAQETPLTVQQKALLAIRDYMVTNDCNRIRVSTAAEITGQTGKQLAVWFNPMGIPAPGAIQFVNADGSKQTARGYTWGGMRDAFHRYLPTASTDTDTDTDPTDAS